MSKMILTLKLNIADEEKKKPLSPNSRKIVTIGTTLIKTSDTILFLQQNSEFSFLYSQCETAISNLSIDVTHDTEYMNLNLRKTIECRCVLGTH